MTLLSTSQVYMLSYVATRSSSICYSLTNFCFTNAFIKSILLSTSFVVQKFPRDHHTEKKNNLTYVRNLHGIGENLQIIIMLTSQNLNE